MILFQNRSTLRCVILVCCVEFMIWFHNLSTLRCVILVCLVTELRRNASMHTATGSHLVLSRLPILKSGNGEWKIPKYGNGDSIHSLGCLRNCQFRRMLYSSSIAPSGGPDKKGRSSYRAVVHASSLKEDMYGVDELEAGRRNPELSGNYRPVTKFKLNPTVLEAEARICTGPTQARPLNEQQEFKVLDTIPGATQWSEGETRAMGL